MRISEMANTVSVTNSLASASKLEQAPDLSWMTGTVTEMAKQRAAASSTSSTNATGTSAPVNFSQTATELKQLSSQQAMMKNASETLAKMKTISDTDLSTQSEADKIAAGVEYNRLQRQLKDYSSRSVLSEASAKAASEDKDKVDVISEALGSKLGTAGLSKKLAAAQSFVAKSKGVVDDKVDSLTSEKKTLSKSLTSLYASAQGVED